MGESLAIQKIGLTGGIGSGKSTVAQLFAELGAYIIDADVISRELMEPGESTLAEVVKLFGQQILDSQGNLNRQKLAQIIFSDEQSRQALNAIVHPAVRQRSEELVSKALEDSSFSGIIIEDIPLLYETRSHSEFDGVIVVITDLEQRLERLVKIRGMSSEDALARIHAQAQDSERQQIADWIIDNSGSYEETQKRVHQVWQDILARRP